MVDSVKTYLTGLNDKQQTAVIHTEGPYMVIAGAGSGKTKVLTTRIAHVLATKKAEPEQMLALTFTNRAAAEMRHRIAAIVGPTAEALWLGTFHSVFMKLLRHEAKHLAYPTHFSIYDTDDSKSLLKQIIREWNLDEKVYRPNYIASRISYAKNKLITAQTYANHPIYQAEDIRMRMPRLSEIYLKYTHYCMQAGAMDFDDLLLQTYLLLHHNTTISAKYQQQFRYLFIDEFQDTNLVQYCIAQKLAAHHQNICVVGDDAQSIYAFRGAHIENMLQFPKDYPQHQITKLEQNYRSTQHIVTIANTIISQNEAQLHKTVWTNNPVGQPIELISALSDTEESHLVIEALHTQKVHQQLRYQDFTILYRTNNQSRPFEEALRKHDIPYRIIGGLSFYQRKEVKDLLAYLRLVVNHNDTEAFKRIINFPKRGIGPTTVDKIFALIAQKKITLWELLSHIKDYLSEASANTIAKFVSLIEAASLKATIEGENAYTIAHYIAQKSGLLKLLYEDQSVEGLTRYEHIQELLNSIKQFVDQFHNDHPTLSHFLQEVALMTKEDQDHANRDAITLMTIHTAKGLEFKYVYLVGMEEELFPSGRMLYSKADLEEERRLFYVAATRAKIKLTLSYALQRYRFGKLIATRPSRFLREVYSQLVAAPKNKINIRTTSKKPLLQTKKTTTPTVETGTAIPGVPPLTIGSIVRHAHFGEGEVKQVQNIEGSHRAVVFFHKFGEKTLLLQYIQLEICKPA